MNRLPWRYMGETAQRCLSKKEYLFRIHRRIPVGSH
jgi:hypothetical protein